MRKLLVSLMLISGTVFANSIIENAGSTGWESLPEKIRTDEARIASTQKYILVNIAEQKLWLYENNEIILESKVIIGKRNKKTPVMSVKAISIVYNPTWYPTPSIIKEGAHITPPGPANPLGHFKLQLVNSYSVYLHSTNAPRLFNQGVRLFSHGCIRVEKMKELTRHISTLPDDDFEKRASSWKTSTEEIDTLPVFVVNWPFVHKDGQFTPIKNPY